MKSLLYTLNVRTCTHTYTLTLTMYKEVFTTQMPRDTRSRPAIYVDLKVPSSYIPEGERSFNLKFVIL